jgi:hypothetical protein
VLGTPEKAVVVDWLDACQGSPAADVCRSHLLIGATRPDLARDHVETYAAITGCPQEAIFAWRPFVAAARLAEGVPSEAEALRRLLDAC